MDIKIAHARNPATAWDIEVTIQGEKDEKVSSVKVVINDFPEPTENVAPPKKILAQTLHPERKLSRRQ